MLMKHESYPAPLLELVSVANQAVKAIPPLFPLSSSVAVNPFLGQTGEPLPVTAARLARVAGARVTPSRAQWAAKYDRGEMTEDDLRGALAALEPALTAPSLEDVERALTSETDAPTPLPTIADLAASASGIDWPGLIDERIGAWAASHFDQGQALWQQARAEGAFDAWRTYASRDLTPEINGLQGFGAFVAGTSRSSWRALGRAAETLGVTTDAAPTVFHRLLMSLGGWAQYGRYELWQAELADQSNTTAAELLTIRLVFEEALFERYKDVIGSDWAHIIAAHAAPITPTADDVMDAVLQDASERAEQRRLAHLLSNPAKERENTRPPLQAAFCIDVRSEVFRRALETQYPLIETIGFAGFYGLATGHTPAGSDVSEARGPVLLNAGVTSRGVEDTKEDLHRRYTARAKRAWGRFKLAAVSSFAFVEATGPVYVGKLMQDALALGHGPHDQQPAPQFDPALDAPTRAQIAAKVLRAMSLTENFARIVMLAGHGASVTNNAHESGLHCGACGGYAGDVNARLLAGLLNDTGVRKTLAVEGINIPDDTLFLAALHDTTTDAVTLYADDYPSTDWRKDIAQLRIWLKAAGYAARTERAGRLPRASREADIARRAKDWSELRPEWGLAGCSSFIAAPRARTNGLSLGGRAFLHSYDWRADRGFGVLELILTAPVVVASWISLQYYGSVVAPKVFGGGNKLLHNVTGGIGVLEGNGGALRAGLPWQSVHDGTEFQHDPLRLSVVVEAPREAITDVLRRHPGVRDLFDNGWLHLLVMDETGTLAWRYRAGLTWVPFATAPDASPPKPTRQLEKIDA